MGCRVFSESAEGVWGKRKGKDNFLCELWSCFTMAFQSTSARMNFAIRLHVFQVQYPLNSGIYQRQADSLSLLALPCGSTKGKIPLLVPSSFKISFGKVQKCWFEDCSPCSIPENHCCSMQSFYFAHRLVQIPLQWASASGQHLYYSNNYLLAELGIRTSSLLSQAQHFTKSTACFPSCFTDLTFWHVSEASQRQCILECALMFGWKGSPSN